MNRISFRDDPTGIMPQYLQDVQNGKLKLSNPIPAHGANLLKTTIPADLNNSEKLEWCYIIRNGVVWQIDTGVPDMYQS